MQTAFGTVGGTYLAALYPQEIDFFFSFCSDGFESLETRMLILTL